MRFLLRLIVRLCIEIFTVFKPLWTLFCFVTCFLVSLLFGSISARTSFSRAISSAIILRFSRSIVLIFQITFLILLFLPIFVVFLHSFHMTRFFFFTLTPTSILLVIKIFICFEFIVMIKWTSLGTSWKMMKLTNSLGFFFCLFLFYSLFFKSLYSILFCFLNGFFSCKNLSFISNFSLHFLFIFHNSSSCIFI